jgi:hypothetical protein
MHSYIVFAQLLTKGIAQIQNFCGHWETRSDDWTAKVCCAGITCSGFGTSENLACTTSKDGEVNFLFKMCVLGIEV